MSATRVTRPIGADHSTVGDPGEASLRTSGAEPASRPKFGRLLAPLDCFQITETPPTPQKTRDDAVNRSESKYLDASLLGFMVGRTIQGPQKRNDVPLFD